MKKNLQIPFLQAENSWRGGEGGWTRGDWRNPGGVLLLKTRKKIDFVLKDRTAHLSSMVQVSGDGVMLGYLNNTEANAKTFTEDGRWTDDHHDRNHLDLSSSLS